MSPEQVAIPVDASGPARVKVTTVGDRWTLAFARDGGLRVEPFGEPYTDVRRACQDAARINERAGQ